MRWVIAFFLGGAVCVSSWLGRVGLASACTCNYPFQNTIRVGTDVVPENAAGVPWWFTWGANPDTTADDEPIELEALVTMLRLDEDGSVEIPTIVEEVAVDGFVIKPAEAWQSGQRYNIRIDANAKGNLDAIYAEQRFKEVEIEIGDPLPEEKPLTLDVQEPDLAVLPVVSNGGECRLETNAAFVDIAIDPREFDFPWPRDQVHYATYVDGELWEGKNSLCDPNEPGRSSRAPGSDRIVAPCTIDGRFSAWVSPGVHSVRIEAALPGTDLVYTTNEVEVELTCPPTDDDDSDDDNSDSDDDDHDDDNSDSDDTDTAASGGGGCALTDSGPHPSRSAWLVGLGLALLARRKRGSLALR